MVRNTFIALVVNRLDNRIAHRSGEPIWQVLTEGAYFEVHDTYPNLYRLLTGSGNLFIDFDLVAYERDKQVQRLGKYLYKYAHKEPCPEILSLVEFYHWIIRMNHTKIVGYPNHPYKNPICNFILSRTGKRAKVTKTEFVTNDCTYPLPPWAVLVHYQMLLKDLYKATALDVFKAMQYMSPYCDDQLDKRYKLS